MRTEFAAQQAPLRTTVSADAFGGRSLSAVADIEMEAECNGSKR